MSFDFSKVSKPKVRTSDPDWSNPVSFFYKLTHPEIKDLFPVQRDVLKNWFSSFKDGENDKMVALNTGGGKTLIGLMVAESIRRDARGKVVYVCPNNFLGKQTVEEAQKYGIKVASYLRLGTDRPTWNDEAAFLENNAICVTTYSAVLNPRSIFKDLEIKGIIFDDAHLSLNLLDDQFSIRSNDKTLIKEITDVFKSSEHIKEKIESIQDGDPLPIVMIPPIEWNQQAETVKKILNKYADITDGLSWINLKEKIDRTFCFVSTYGIDIGLLYPDVKNHPVFHSSVHRVYLSATLPNLDDITRVFGVTPTRIEVENPDYRPQRLFVFSKKTEIDDPDATIRAGLGSVSSKNLVLAPSNDALTSYKEAGALVPENSDDVPRKIEEFKEIDSGILALANRYDGIDMPGETCHSLVIDGLPYTGNLKNRFFSEYFHNHRNSFLRSIIASKLIQAFGRTIRANNDYSIIFLLGDKLNSWIINKDNQKFFNPDLYEDIEIGLNISESLVKIDDLQSLAREFLGQTDNWNSFLDERKSSLGPTQTFSTEDEERNISVAQKERKIHDLFMSGNYRLCLEAILESENELSEYSKPILGLYLSIAAICCLKTGDDQAEKLSGDAYAINPIFGTPVKINDQTLSLQAQRIIRLNSPIPKFDWSATTAIFDENLKKLGDFLGFSARRPELEGDGTLDVCWVDEEKKIIIAFENKVGKTNGTLSKKEADQCSGHLNWLAENYPGYLHSLFVVGNLTSYNELATPNNELKHVPVSVIEEVSSKVSTVHRKKMLPEQIDPTLDTEELRISSVIAGKKVINLPKKKFT